MTENFLQKLESVNVKSMLGPAFNKQNTVCFLSEKQRGDLLKQLKIDLPALSKHEK